MEMLCNIILMPLFIIGLVLFIMFFYVAISDVLNIPLEDSKFGRLILLLFLKKK